MCIRDRVSGGSSNVLVWKRAEPDSMSVSSELIFLLLLPRGIWFDFYFHTKNQIKIKTNENVFFPLAFHSRSFETGRR